MKKSKALILAAVLVVAMGVLVVYAAPVTESQAKTYSGGYGYGYSAYQYQTR